MVVLSEDSTSTLKGRREDSCWPLAVGVCCAVRPPMFHVFISLMN